MLAWQRAAVMLQADVIVMEAAQNSKQAQLALFQEEQKRIEEDIDVPLRLKQGQVEIQPQGIVDSSMDDAVLVALQLVQVGCGVDGWGSGSFLQPTWRGVHVCITRRYYWSKAMNREAKAISGGLV